MVSLLYPSSIHVRDRPTTVQVSITPPQAASRHYWGRLSLPAFLRWLFGSKNPVFLCSFVLTHIGMCGRLRSTSRDGFQLLIRSGPGRLLEVLACLLGIYALRRYVGSHAVVVRGRSYLAIKVANKSVSSSGGLIAAAISGPCTRFL